MPEEYYKPNSFKSKEEVEKKPDITPITTGRKKEKSELQKARSTFFAEDVKTVGSSVWGGVIVPALKKLISEMVKVGIDVLVYGDRTRTPDPDDYRGISGRIKYSRGPSDKDRYTPVTRSAVYDYGEVTVGSEMIRQDIIRALDDILKSSQYGVVTVGHLYSLRNIPTEPTDFDYGWRDIRGYEIKRVGYGSNAEWIIRMPRAMPV